MMTDERFQIVMEWLTSKGLRSVMTTSGLVFFDEDGLGVLVNNDTLSALEREMHKDPYGGR